MALYGNNGQGDDRGDERRHAAENAVALGMGRRNASKHVQNILHKLEVSSRTAAATHAIRQRLV